ncbi:unnamed protein product [Pedinophyceae sp. YPF-701]|nr:unnamed protein product [Pedinophyceae sp. YPF-701]
MTSRAEEASDPQQGGSGGDYNSFADYVRFLRACAPYRTIMLAETLSIAGNWFAWVATLSAVTATGGASGLLLGTALVMKYLPSLLAFPIAGAAADTFNRQRIMVLSCVFGGAMSLLLAGVVAGTATMHSVDDTTALTSQDRDVPRLVALNVLVFLWALSSAFYEPARRAVVPAVVSPRQLPLATTLDSMVWSVMTAVFAAIGGYSRALLGPSPCFLIDATTFALNGVLVARMDLPHNAILPADDAHHAAQPQPDTFGAFLRSSARKGGAMVAEGLSFVARAGNRDVLAIVLVKGCGSLAWGAADVLGARLAELPQYQALGDAPATMGWLFAAVGMGCLVGPIVFNRLTPVRGDALLKGIWQSFAIMAGGYSLMAMSPGISTLIAATVARSAGSAVLWNYSSLILQYRVGHEMLGRVFALELALSTAGECASGLGGGLLVDGVGGWGGLSIKQVVQVMAGLAGAVCVSWLLYWLRSWRSFSRLGPDAEPAAAREHELAPLVKAPGQGPGKVHWDEAVVERGDVEEAARGEVRRRSFAGSERRVSRESEL